MEPTKIQTSASGPTEHSTTSNLQPGANPSIQRQVLPNLNTSSPDVSAKHPGNPISSRSQEKPLHVDDESFRAQQSSDAPMLTSNNISSTSQLPVSHKVSTCHSPSRKNINTSFTHQTPKDITIHPCIYPKDSLMEVETQDPVISKHDNFGETPPISTRQPNLPQK